MDKSSLLRIYIEQEVYKYLAFNPDTTDMMTGSGARITNPPSNVKIRIRDASNVQKPLLIINKYYIENDAVLDIITIADVLNIDIHKPSEKLSSIYGVRAQYGLILIDINKRKWNKVRKCQ